MSTTIYSGYIYRGSFLELFKQLELFRPKIREEIESQLTKEVVSSIYQIYDFLRLGYKDFYPIIENDQLKPGTYTIRQALDEVLKSNYKGSKSGIVSSFDYYTALHMYPLEDKCLMIFAGNTKLEEFFFNNFKVDYYGYWDNTDPDESCSEEEWAQRQSDWKKVFKHTFFTADMGLTFQFSETYAPVGLYATYKLKEVEKPSLEARFKNHIINKCINLDRKTEGLPETSMSWVMDRVQYYKSEEGKPYYGRIQSEVLSEVGEDLPFEEILECKFEI